MRSHGGGVLRRWSVTTTTLIATASFVTAQTTQPIQREVSRLPGLQAGLRGSLDGLQGIEPRWTASERKLEVLLHRVEAGRGAGNPNALVQEVLRESYLETGEDLRLYGEKVKYFNEAKKRLRDQLTGIRAEERKLTPSRGRSLESSLAPLEHVVQELDRRGRDLQVIETRLSQRAAKLKAMPPGGNVLEILARVLKESLNDMNEDKKYYLRVIQETNKAAEALNAYLRGLTDASAALAQEEKNAGKDAGKGGTTRSSDPPRRPAAHP